MTQSGGYCTSCGTAYAAGQASCGTCGRPVAPPPSRGTNWTLGRDEVEPPPVAEETGSWFGRAVSEVFGWGCGGLLLIVVLIVVVIYLVGSH